MKNIHAEPFRLGRKKAADPNDRKFAASVNLAGLDKNTFADLPRRKRRHKRGPQLNQGQTSRCVWFTMTGLILAGPTMQLVPGVSIHPVARETIVDPATLDNWCTTQYIGCQARDEWPGGEPDYYGTSGRAGAKMLKDLGYASEGYYWLNTVEEIARYIALYGPVPLGLDWFEGMDELDGSGFVNANGKWRGGHEILAGGVDVDEEYVELWQSWGSIAEGAPYTTAKLSFADLDYELRQGADALAIPELRVPK